MVEKIKVPITGMNNTYASVPNVYHVERINVLFNSLHGDGLFPVEIKINGKVKAIGGMTLRVYDYLGAVNGKIIFLGGKRVLSENVYKDVLVPNTFKGKTFYVLLTLPETIVDDPDNADYGKPIKLQGKGEVVLSETELEDTITLAKITLPANATAITQDMIDESVKEYLPDVQKSLSALRDYINEAVERAKREIYNYIINEYTPQIRDEIAQSDAQVRAELDAKISNIQNQINDLNVSVDTIRQSLRDFQSYVNEKIQNLEQRTDALQIAVADLSNAVVENQAFTQRLQENISRVEGDIVAIQLQLEEHLRRIEALETQTAIQQGLFDLTNAINIAKTNWRIQQIHNLSVNELYKGFTDALVTLENIDESLSSNYYHDAGLSRIRVRVVPPPELVSWWRFDQVTGTVARDELGRNNGILNGPTWVPGKIGYALNFGGGGYVRVPDSPSISAIQNAITITAWFQIREWKEQFIISNGVAYGSGGFAIYIGPWTWGVPIGFGLGNPETWLPYGNPGERLALNTWYHVAATWSRSDKLMRIYLNAVPSPRTQIFDSYITDVSRDLFIGSNSGGGQCLNGIIDEVTLWNRALTEGEVQTIYNDGIEGLLSVEFTPATIVTKAKNFGLVPSRVMLAAEYGGDVSFEISRDDGTTWYDIAPNELFTFPESAPSGQLVRLRVKLNSVNAYLDNYGVFVKG
jgi:predicted  nucleic acid-binding Zn-ribbon protein